MNYTQVKMTKGEVSQTSWIPSTFAQLNRPLMLKEQGRWTNGWIITEVWQTIPEEQLPKHVRR